MIELSITCLKRRAASQAAHGFVRHCTRRRGNGEPGFTLLEVIGVVALLAILASLLTPAMIQSMDQAAKVRDASEVKTMADALQSAVRRHAQIPDTNYMPAFIAAEMGVAASQVITNSRGIPRLFLADPLLTLGTGALPYDQTLNPRGITNGLPRSNLRVIIFSSLGPLLPEAKKIDFNTAWATPDSTTPADWTAWPGQGSDLTIQRLDFTALFHRLILNNQAGAGTSPNFSIESGGVASGPIPVSSIYDAWYLDKTVVSLFYASGLQLKAVVSEDVSYFYDTSWMGSLK